MGILTKLTTQGSNLSNLNGATPPTMNGASDQSKLHNQYSVNGVPIVVSKPNPSTLDLDGKTPSKYLDNPPK